MGYAFISYSSKNRASADSLRELLKRNGIATWMAPCDIPAGKEYAEMIAEAVKNCACFVLILTRQSQKSKWVSKELERAVNYKKPIIPVMLEEVDLDSKFELYIGEYQLIEVNRLDESSLNMRRIIAGIKAHTSAETSDYGLVEKEPAPVEKPDKNEYIGQIIELGRYYFDDEDQMQPIRWKIIRMTNDKALLISCDVLDGKPFNTDVSTNLWKYSSIRQWMNKDFYDAAFSEEEKSRILTTMVYTERCGKTEDHIFLLSREEAQTYFSSNSARCCKPTNYAKINGVYPSINPNSLGNCWWWLRTLCSNPRHACYIGYDGSLRNYAYVADDSAGVRPAMYVALDSIRI